MWSVSLGTRRVVAVLLALCAIGGFAMGVTGAPSGGRLPGEGLAAEGEGPGLVATDAQPEFEALDPNAPPPAPPPKTPEQIAEEKAAAEKAAAEKAAREAEDDEAEAAALPPVKTSELKIPPPKTPATPAPKAPPSSDPVGDLLDSTPEEPAPPPF